MFFAFCAKSKAYKFDVLFKDITCFITSLINLYTYVKRNTKYDGYNIY